MNKLVGNTKRKRIISMFLLISFLSEIITPTVSFALTGGPSQPEVEAFTPVNTSEMVDLTSGDFKYNIPLMDVGGYPINIAYNSGIGMDQEASWTGLGWNLNVGSINRNMRGLPDDFNGDPIDKEFNMKDNNTFGVNVGVGVEIFGWKKSETSNSSGSVKASIGLGVTYNNYTGIGMEQTRSIGISAGNSGKGSMNAGLGMKSSNSGGLTVSPNVSFSYKVEEKQKGDVKTTGAVGIGIGVSVNSRSGMKDLSITSSYNRTKEKILMIPTLVDGVDINTGIVLGSKSGGASSAGVVNFGASTYIPQIQNNMVNNSVALSFKLGTTVFGLDGDITMGGYFSNQSLTSSNSSVSSYGYMYSQNGQNSDNVLMDFNREKDQAFSRYTKNLPITNNTYDVFSITGQGIGGTFRPFRSSVSYMFDNSATTTSDSYSGGVEFAAANTAHLGVNVSVVDVHTTTGKWSDDNDAKSKLSAVNTNGNKDFEPFYFKEVGEKSDDAVQSGLYNKLGKDLPYRVKITGTVNHKATNDIEESGNTTLPLTAGNYISDRQKRNQLMSSLTLEEAKLYGFDKTIYNGNNTSGMNISSNARDHHIAELTALRLDGSRYIYGLPAYNNLQEEVTFNASSSTTSSNHMHTPINAHYDGSKGFVVYNTGDRSTSNGKGIDHYYNKVKTPAYAHSYLLTSIVSADYVDLKNDGLTDDDYGNYTKFEYVKVPDYHWRTPYNQLRANFNEVGKSIENDDQGNFIYGEKELWFTKKIETKNYIAIFDLEDNRHDATGVTDIDGSVPNDPSTAKTKYIKSISLYSKPEYNADQSVNKVNAVPIKVVHFVYDYSLCRNIPNNSVVTEGKLTLKEIYFTYGKSNKAAFSKYKFKYEQLHRVTSLSNNFDYHPKAYDRWGNFMPVNNNQTTYSSFTSTNYQYDSPLNNSEFPYVDQYSKDDADFRASAWNLTDIDLPSGGSIKINYESDDYAFVQNKPAMQMMKVLGITNSSNALGSAAASNTTGQLYDVSSGGWQNNLFLHFELTENNTSSDAEIRENYLKDINSAGNFLYFRFLVNLTSTNPYPLGNSGDHYEYVSGYAEVDGGVNACGFSGGPSVVGPNNYRMAYVKLKDVVLDDKTTALVGANINPITKAALNFGKSHYNNIVWDASFSPPADVIGAVKQLASEATGGFIKTMIQAVLGPNASLVARTYGQQFIYGKSWIRLYNPNGHKFGGGSRVKELTIKDNWNILTTPEGTPISTSSGQEDSEYGQTFTYETDFSGKTISSGVASYEPMLGGDENPFRQPVYMGPNKWSVLTPDERFFMEEPFGETFFPSASIAYSKVIVKNKIPQNINVKTHGTGYVVHEFYTAKDYPTITGHTAIFSKQWKPALGGLLKITARDYVAATQGYVIKLNDMHGKQKAQSVYSEGSTSPLSKIEYFYKTKGGNYTNYGLKDIYSDAECTANELDNSCLVIDRDGTIRKTTIGMDFDAVADFRENETTTIMGGAQINLSMFLVGVFPGIVPTIWPDFSYEKTRFRSAVMTKVISNYGILEKTTAKDLGSEVTTSNLAYDAQTGDVLVTKTKNDYHDDIYSLKYPAYWGYDLMGPAYKNIGLTDVISFNGNGLGLSVNAEKYYNIGDEIAIGNGNIGWICSVTSGVSGSISVIDKQGNFITNSGPTLIKVLRSGRRNLLGTQMASLTSLVSPLINYDNGVPSPKLQVNTNSKVLNTSAIEYSDQWQTFKGYDNSTPGSCVCSITSAGQNAINQVLATIASPNFLSLITHTINLATFQAPPGSPPVCSTLAEFPPSPNFFTYNWQYFVYNPLGAAPTYSLITDPSSCTGKIVLCVPGSFTSASRLAGDSTTNSSSFSNIVPQCNSFTISPGPSCPPFVSCNNTTPTNLKCGVDVGDKVNPFIYGIRGNWRPKTTWSYLDSRVQTTSAGSNNNIDIRKDGYINNYSSFYNPTPNGFERDINYYNYWTYTSAISKHTPNGVEVENKDALIRYSSALYGYNESLPIAVASNAQLQEVAFDGFEDYDFSSGICNQFSKEHHFDFYDYKINLDKFNSHTGKYSMKVISNSSLSISKKLMSIPVSGPQTSACNYILQSADFIYPFTPITYNGNKKYVLSYWVKEKVTNSASTDVLDYQNSDITLSISGSGSVLLGALKKSEVIDGWQRFEREFTISSFATGKINIALVNTNTNNTVTSYFDDIRIHPFNSNMKSFVYNPVTLKYSAELDANNFATFYEYDEEGSLIRVKKETEKGIMTIQETKNHTKR